MSRTDKTAPWRVRQRDNRLAYDHAVFPGVIERAAKWWVGEARCNCPGVCAGQAERKAKARKRRREGKLLARRFE